MKSFQNYGARGITMCPEWRDDFAKFLADMGPCPAGYTIERIDNDGPYSPSNCRWATRRDQMRNTRASHLIEYDGVTQPLICWSEKFKIPVYALSARIGRLGWSIEKALHTPLRRDSRRTKSA